MLTNGIPQMINIFDEMNRTHMPDKQTPFSHIDCLWCGKHIAFWSYYRSSSGFSFVVGANSFLWRKYISSLTSFQSYHILDDDFIFEFLIITDDIWNIHGLWTLFRSNGMISGCLMMTRLNYWYKCFRQGGDKYIYSYSSFLHRH